MEGSHAAIKFQCASNEFTFSKSCPKEHILAQKKILCLILTFKPLITKDIQTNGPTNSPLKPTFSESKGVWEELKLSCSALKEVSSLEMVHCRKTTVTSGVRTVAVLRRVSGPQFWEW